MSCQRFIDSAFHILLSLQNKINLIFVSLYKYMNIKSKCNECKALWNALRINMPPLFNDKAPDSEFSVTGSGPTWEEQQFFLLLPSRQGFQTHRQSTRSGKNLLLSGFELRLSTLESSALPACHSRAELISQN